MAMFGVLEWGEFEGEGAEACGQKLIVVSGVLCYALIPFYARDSEFEIDGGDAKLL